MSGVLPANLSAVSTCVVYVDSLGEPRTCDLLDLAGLAGLAGEGWRPVRDFYAWPGHHTRQCCLCALSVADQERGICAGAGVKRLTVAAAALRTTGRAQPQTCRAAQAVPPRRQPPVKPAIRGQVACQAAASA